MVDRTPAGATFCLGEAEVTGDRQKRGVLVADWLNTVKDKSRDCEMCWRSPGFNNNIVLI